MTELNKLIFQLVRNARFEPTMGEDDKTIVNNITRQIMLNIQSAVQKAREELIATFEDYLTPLSALY